VVDLLSGARGAERLQHICSDIAVCGIACPIIQKLLNGMCIVRLIEFQRVALHTYSRKLHVAELALQSL
jgi:hypothetical protein